jgi:DNA-binding GntR family transcriptional regulator
MTTRQWRERAESRPPAANDRDGWTTSQRRSDTAAGVGTPAANANRADTISPPSLVELVAARLRTLVVSGTLQPGEHLVEERLTERFGISRPPLREALRLLQQEGLITRLPRRGVVVTPLTAEDVREIYSLRSALEHLAIELGVPVVDPARLEVLRSALAALDRAANQRDREALLDANLRFHQALCALPNHRRLLQAYQSLTLQLRLCMAMNIRFREQLFGDFRENVARHRELFQLIEAGDRAAVLDALGRHGERSFMERLDELIGQEAEA